MYKSAGFADVGQLLKQLADVRREAAGSIPGSGMCVYRVQGYDAPYVWKTCDTPGPRRLSVYSYE